MYQGIPKLVNVSWSLKDSRRMRSTTESSCLRARIYSYYTGVVCDLYGDTMSKITDRVLDKNSTKKLP